MAHKIHLVSPLLIVLAIQIFFYSCIDDRYDLAKGLSGQMALGGDSLAIPIGSTDTIKISRFLDSTDTKMLKTMEDGGYGLTMKDSVNTEIPKIDQTYLKIDDKTFSTSKKLSFGDISLADFSIPAVTVDKDVSLNLNSVDINNFDIPSISKSSTFSAGISDFALTNLNIGDKEINAGKNDLFSGINLPQVPNLPTPEEITITDQAPVSFNSSSQINYSVSVPDGITGINKIDLSSNAYLEVSIELSGASDILTAGTVIPSIALNPSDLFIFTTPPAGGVITFGSANSLTKANGYKTQKTYAIEALNITETPSGGKLNILKNILAEGTITMTGAKAMSDKISAIPGIDLVVKVSLKNMVIESTDFNIPVTRTNISGNTAINISSSIPDEINKVNNVYLCQSAINQNTSGKIMLNIKALNLPTMINKTVKIDNLAIKFPDEFVFEPVTGLSGNTYTISDLSFDPVAGKTIELSLKRLSMSAIPITGGYLNWNGTINYSGMISFSGRINSKNIPSASDDIKINSDLSSALAFKSAEVTTKTISRALPATEFPFSLNAEIADQVKHIGKINLASGSKLQINIIKPDLPLTLSGNNINIVFPDLFVFKSALPMNTYIINGTIPDKIELELSSLNINRDIIDGKISVSDKIYMTGGINLLAGNVSSTDIETLSSKKIAIQAKSSDMKISSTTIQLNTISASINDSTYIDVDVNNIPDEIVSLDSIILGDNAKLIITADISNMPNLSNPAKLSMKVKLPDMIGFAPGTVDSQNNFYINESLSDWRLSKSLGIRSLRFNGKNINGSLPINEKIKFNSVVTIESPSVNSEELNGSPITTNVQVKLTGVKFKSAYGKVNPRIDPIKENISIDDIPDFLKNKDVVLDVTKPALSLKTESNIGLPVNVSVNLEPFRDGSRISGGGQSVSLRIPKAISPLSPAISNFWIAPDSVGKPNEYAFVQSDIQKMFRTVPDKIEINANASADMSRQHFIDFDAAYKMKLKYEVRIPLAFGKDLSIIYKDTIKDIDESIAKIALAGKKLEIQGSVANSIPLEIDLELVPLDKDNKVINIEPARQIISAGAFDCTPVISELEMTLNDPDKLLKNLRGFELIFKASSNETVAGAPIKPGNFLKADLKARINGGINIDE